MSDIAHSVSQTVDVVDSAIQKAMVEVLRKMGIGNHTRRQEIRIPKDFETLAREVTSCVTRQVRRQVQVSKAALKQRVREILAYWRKENVLVLKTGQWHFKAVRLRELAQGTPEEARKSSSSAPTRYLNRRELA